MAPASGHAASANSPSHIGFRRIATVKAYHRRGANPENRRPTIGLRVRPLKLLLSPWRRHLRRDGFL